MNEYLCYNVNLVGIVIDVSKKTKKFDVCLDLERMSNCI